jgi:hypothetical protein
MAVRNFVNGIVQWESLTTGISVTLVLLIVAVVLLYFGAINLDTKIPDGFEKVKANKDGEETSTCIKNTNGTCKKYSYKSNYKYTGPNGKICKFDNRPGKANSIDVLYNQKTGECREDVIERDEAIALIVFGGIFLLCAASAAYITYDPDRREIFFITSYMSGGGYGFG